jgi:hypothetical protein
VFCPVVGVKWGTDVESMVGAVAAGSAPLQILNVTVFPPEGVVAEKFLLNMMKAVPVTVVLESVNVETVPLPLPPLAVVPRYIGPRIDRSCAGGTRLSPG